MLAQPGGEIISSTERSKLHLLVLNEMGGGRIQDYCTVRTWRWFDVVREQKPSRVRFSQPPGSILSCFMEVCMFNGVKGECFESAP